AEDGIRSKLVTGVQTCALPIYTVTHEFNGVIKHFVSVEESAQRDDHVFADDTWRKFSFENNLRHRRNLPPRHARRPNARSVRAKIGRASCRERAEILVGAGHAE